MNGFTLLVVIVLVAGIPLAFRAGMLRERRDARPRAGMPLVRAAERDETRPSAEPPAAASAARDAPPATSRVPAPVPPSADDASPPAATPEAGDARLVAERARIIRAGPK